MRACGASGFGWRRRLRSGTVVFASIFVDAREELRLTIEEVAARANVSPETVARIESGDLWPYLVRSIERSGRTVHVEVELEPEAADELEIVASTVDRPVGVFVKP